jgi:flagellar motor switch protein FliG
MRSAEAFDRPASLSRRQKAAVILRLLDGQGAALALTGLPAAVQEDLVRQTAALRRVDQQTLAEIALEFIAEMENCGLSFAGGVDGAIARLESVLGADAAGRMRRRLTGAGGDDAWDEIVDLEQDDLVEILKAESPEVGAVILSKLKVAKAAEILGALPGAEARRLAFVMSKIGAASPATVDRIAVALQRQRSGRKQPAFAGSAVDRVGALLNYSSANTREDVLEGIEALDAGFAGALRKTIFTFANIPERLDIRDVPKVIRGVDAQTLVEAFAGAPGLGQQGVVDFLLANMSQRLAGQLKEEVEARGEVKPKEAEAAMGRVIQAIRGLEAAGEVVLIVPEEE